MTPPSIQDTLAQIRESHRQPLPDEIRKAAGITQALGLVNYDLQRPAIATYPWFADLIPLRATLPRVKGNGGTATNWNAITGINTANLPVGVSEGNRNAPLTSTVAAFVRTYQGIGFEDFVTFEADYAAEQYDDAKARAVEGTMRSVMIAEEKMLLGGNVGVALGTTPTPTAAGATTGGALSDATYYVGCIALSYMGYQNSAVTATGVPQTIARTNADSSSDTINGGAARPSAQATGVVLNAGTAVQRITATVTAVQGAVGYAWYLGTAAGSLKLQQITTINSVNFSTALLTTTQEFVGLAATDYSRQTGYAFDGMLYQTGMLSTSGAYYVALPTGTAGTGTIPTTDSAGGITQIDTAMASFFATWKVGPDEAWMSAGHLQDISKMIMAGGFYRLNMGASEVGADIVGGGRLVSKYLNKSTGQLMNLRVHPYLMDGTIIFRKKTNPYPMSGVGNVDEVRYRRDMYQIEWPLRTRKYEYGVYEDEVYVNYMPFLSGAITNVARV